MKPGHSDTDRVGAINHQAGKRKCTDPDGGLIYVCLLLSDVDAWLERSAHWRTLNCLRDVSNSRRPLSLSSLIRPVCLLWSSLLSQLRAAPCYWLIESVFRAAALPRRLVLARAHCNRTNENTPHHLPRRDTPSPSPCPSTLASPAFLFLFPR